MIKLIIEKTEYTSVEIRYSLNMRVGDTWVCLDVSSVDPQDVVDFGEKLAVSFSDQNVPVDIQLLYTFS